MVQTTNSAAKSKEAIAAEDAVRQRAARQAARKDVAPVDAERKVTCVVLPAGHGKISMGVHVGGIGEVHYEEGETFETALSIALNLYRRNYVNFEGAREAADDQRAEMQRQILAESAEAQVQKRILEQAGLA